MLCQRSGIKALAGDVVQNMVPVLFVGSFRSFKLEMKRGLDDVPGEGFLATCLAVHASDLPVPLVALSGPSVRTSTPFSREAPETVQMSNFMFSCRAFVSSNEHQILVNRVAGPVFSRRPCCTQSSRMSSTPPRSSKATSMALKKLVSSGFAVTAADTQYPSSVTHSSRNCAGCFMTANKSTTRAPFR